MLSNAEMNTELDDVGKQLALCFKDQATDFNRELYVSACTTITSHLWS